MTTQHSHKARPLFDPPIVRRAIIDSFLKLDPRREIRNPVMFTVFVGSILTTCLGVYALANPGQESARFILGVSAWLWFTVLFANFAEAMAEAAAKLKPMHFEPRAATYRRRSSRSRDTAPSTIRRRPPVCGWATSCSSKPAT
jgi:high-affinity K+ transport system ATPase subunit B